MSSYIIRTFHSGSAPASRQVGGCAMLSSASVARRGETGLGKCFVPARVSEGFLKGVTLADTAISAAQHRQKAQNREPVSGKRRITRGMGCGGNAISTQKVGGASTARQKLLYSSGGGTGLEGHGTQRHEINMENSQLMHGIDKYMELSIMKYYRTRDKSMQLMYGIDKYMELSIIKYYRTRDKSIKWGQAGLGQALALHERDQVH